MKKERIIESLIHDIKNPINSLIGFLELCFEEEKKHKESSIRGFLSPALNSARMINLLLDELKFVIFRPSSYLFNEGSLDLMEEFMKLIELHAIRIRNKKLSIFLEAEKTKNTKSPWYYYTLSKFLFRSIIRNVFDNATKFTPPGGKIEIFISRNGVFLVIEIKNSFISNSEPNQEQSGTNLGLILIKEFIENMNGEVKIEKEKDFSVKLYFPFVTPSLWAE